MNRDLFLAILSLDSYNRGYGQRINGLSAASGTMLGYATILEDANDQEGVSVAAGFYAISYEWNGETIISYRGTDGLNNIL